MYTIYLYVYTIIDGVGAMSLQTYLDTYDVVEVR